MSDNDEVFDIRYLIPFGYAPGNYDITCMGCFTYTTFCDKHARRCEDCARKARARAMAAPAEDARQRQIEEVVSEPEPGSKWLHHSGRIYTVLFLTNLGGRGDYPRTVVYEGENGQKWSGPLGDWHRRMSLLVPLDFKDSKGLKT
jgi:hypothetical protein